MAQDPRTFLVKNCAAAVASKQSDDAKRKEFFGALGAIGDIEALNDVGASDVAKGLRSLSKISDSIRTGDTNSAIIPNSRGYVLDAVNINQNAAEQAKQFNPGVVNKAYAQADNILDQVKGGNYKLEDVPGTFTDIQNLSSLTKGIFNDGAPESRDLEICGASPYAIDLIKYAPKYKFLFVVQIDLSAPYKPGLEENGNQLAFVVKSSTRPNINIEHEEVNMYNFWTRIPKRVVYEPITMRFYDDNKGLAHMFYTTYLRNISPITRLGGMDKAGVLSVEYLQSQSMNKNSINVPGAASLTALEGPNTSIINEIRLFHIYDYGRFMNVYHFHHAKLMTMNLDDLDMADTGAGNEIELQFAYDALHITPKLAVADNIERVTSMSGERVGALYPIKPNFGDAPEVEQPGNDPDETPKPDALNVIRSVGATVTDAVSGAIDSVTGVVNSATGLVSNAFDKASNFAGSFFQ